MESVSMLRCACSAKSASVVHVDVEDAEGETSDLDFVFDTDVVNNSFEEDARFWKDAYRKLAIVDTMVYS